MDEYELTGKDKVYIIPTGDWHVGSEDFNQEFYHYWLKMVEKIRNPKRFYYMGDLGEFARKSLGNSPYRQVMTPVGQMNWIADNAPLNKGENVKCVVGNHEARLINEFDFSVMEYIGKSLGAEVGNQFIDEFKVNGEVFRVHLKHGRGTNAYAHLAQGKIIRESARIEADLFLQGHNHRLDFFSEPVRSLRSDTGVRRRYYAFTGSFLNYGSYADAMGLPYLPPAFQFLYMDKHGILENTNYFIDQRRPDLMELP